MIFVDETTIDGNAETTMSYDAVIPPFSTTNKDWPADRAEKTADFPSGEIVKEPDTPDRFQLAEILCK